MNDRKIQRWEWGILVCIVLFMISTETNWWYWPLCAIPLLLLVGLVQKKEAEKMKIKTRPAPMAVRKKSKQNPFIWIYLWIYALVQKIKSVGQGKATR